MPAAGTIAALWRDLLGKPAALKLACNDEIAELLGNADVAASSARKHVPAVLIGADGDAADFSAATAKLQAAMAAEEELGPAHGKKKMRTS